METISALKQAEGRLLQISDKVTTMSAKLEDIVFRAQRIAAAKKNGGHSTDTMFLYDLQAFRRELRTFSHDIGSLPSSIASIERTAAFEEAAMKFASSVWRVSDRLSKALGALHTQAALAHGHIRESDARVEAWFILQELEQMAEKGKVLPNAANKIVIIVSTPPAGP
jgi:hypothetical protein